MGHLPRLALPSTAPNGAVDGQTQIVKADSGPWSLPITGGYLPSSVGQWMNWWQMGYDPVGGGYSAMVEACVSAYSQTIAMCPGDHWRTKENGGRERVETSALSRLLREPNDYQSSSDFMLNIVRSLYLDGNAYAVALRNERFEVSQLHIMNSRQTRAQLASTGEIFYTLGGNPILERRLMQHDGTIVVPERDVLHIRLHTPRHPLIGETPLAAAFADVAASGAMTQQQLTFYQNMARPSIVLITDQTLSQQQADELRSRWNDQARGLNSGGVPILSSGLKPQELSQKAEEAQLAEVMKLTDQHIALVFRIPLQILGLGGTPGGPTEALINTWLSTGLGFAVNHVEEAFGRFFQLKGQPWEYVEFDTSVLLRSDFKTRVESLKTAVGGGLFKINEAREELSKPSVKGGDMIRVQQQDVPLDWWETQVKPGDKAPAPAAPAKPANDDEAPPKPKAAAEKDYAALRSRFRAAHARNLPL